MRICFNLRLNFYKTAGVNFTLRRQYSVCHSETPEKESFSCFAKCCKIGAEILLSRTENVREFHRAR